MGVTDYAEGGPTGQGVPVPTCRMEVFQIAPTRASPDVTRVSRM